MQQASSEMVPGSSTCVVMPLIYCEAEAEKDFYEFDFGVGFVRAELELLARMKQIVEGYGGPTVSSGGDIFGNKVHWVLVMRYFPHTQEPSFPSLLQYDFAEGFLAAMSIVRSTRTSAPIMFKGAIHEKTSKIASIAQCDDYTLANYEQPVSYWPEKFAEPDFECLQRVWRSVAELLHLTTFSELPATRDSLEEIGRDGPSLVSVAYPTRKPTGAFGRRYVMGYGGDVLEVWARWGTMPTIFQRFRQMSDPVNIVNRTRLGRALGLFQTGIRLPRLYAFLSMCLVLETLYVREGDAIFRVLPNRLARTISRQESTKGQKEVRAYSKRARRVYGARCEIVHGKKLVDLVDESVQKDAFSLARESLSKILCDKHLFRLFSGLETEDKLAGGERDLQKYFEGLDRKGGSQK